MQRRNRSSCNKSSCAGPCSLDRVGDKDDAALARLRETKLERGPCAVRVCDTLALERRRAPTGPLRSGGEEVKQVKEGHFRGGLFPLFCDDQALECQVWGLFLSGIWLSFRAVSSCRPIFVPPIVGITAPQFWMCQCSFLFCPPFSQGIFIYHRVWPI